MKRNVATLAVVVIAVSVMIFGGRYLAKRQPTGGLAGDIKGKTAPDFELQSLDGKTVHLSDYKGKAVLLNFWATWCSPCKVEMPWFVELQKQYEPQGFEVVGIAMDDAGTAEIAKFAKEMGVNYTILIGKEAVSEQFGNVQYLPTSFYIDRDGRIVDRVFGLVGRGEIEDSIKRAIAGSPAHAELKPDETKAENKSQDDGAKRKALPGGR